MATTPQQILVAFSTSLLLTSTGLADSGEPGMRLIKTDPEETGHWVKPEEISTSPDFHYMDITFSHLPPSTQPRQAQPNVTYPATMKFQSTVTDAVKLIQEDRLRAFMLHFTNYFTRHYQTQTGREAAQWLHEQVNQSIASSSYRGNATVRYFKHHLRDTEWIQPSVIARLEGTFPNLIKEVVVIGAHLDSTNGRTKGRAPGADDNGSGSAVLLEALKVLLEFQFVPRRSIEFQWYAAEEYGLLGSLNIAELYYNTSTKVVGMANFDSVGYFAGIKQIGIVRDVRFTHRGLNEYMKAVIEQYTEYAPLDRDCGYPCSDHAAFTQFDFPATTVIEAPDNSAFHTERDNITLINFEQLMEFTKLGVAYVIETEGNNCVLEMGGSRAGATAVCLWYVLRAANSRIFLLHFTLINETLVSFCNFH